MKRSPLLALAASCLLALPARAVTLADADSALPITIHPTAGETVREAAADLARILGGMTGSLPEIRESEEPIGVVIGTSSQFKVFNSDPGLAIRKTFDGREAFIVRPDEEAKRVWILGNREDGASHGVYSALMRYGYRALMPGAHWEVIPRHPRVEIDQPFEGRPKVLTRQIWAGFGTFDKEQNHDVQNWRRRNRLGSSIAGQIGHSWESMIRHHKPAFEANPQLFGEKEDGSLNRLSLRHGSTAVVDFTLDFFAKRLVDPRQGDILSLAPTDGDNYTRDAETKARGPIHESFYWYVNEVAKRTATLAPEHLVGTTAYYLHAQPPSFDLEPNVLVLAATMFGSGGMPLEQFFEVWSKKSRYFGIRDYIFSGYPRFADHPDGGYAFQTLERQAAWFRNFPVAYYSAEGLWEWGLRGMHTYLLAQLLWDPEQEVPAMVTSFCHDAFGPGAEAMRQYYDEMNPEGRAVRRHRLARAVRHLQSAATAAAGTPEALARLNDLKAFLIHAVYIDRSRKLDHDNSALLENAVEDLTWNFRLRRSYILNYNCNRRFWMVNRTLLRNHLERDRNTFWLKGTERPETPEEQQAVIAAIFGEKWKLDKGFIVPVDADDTALIPPSGEEIAQRFERDVLSEYPETEVEEATYSDHFVPVDLGNERPASNDEAAWFGATAELLVWQPAATTLQWEVTPNVRYPGRKLERRFRATVTDPLGDQPEPVTLPLDEQPHALEVPIIHPGITTVELHSMRSGFLLRPASWDYLSLPTGPNTILFLGSNAAKRTFSNPPVYFYVPKGTQTIHAYNDLPGRLVKHSRIAVFNGEEVVPEQEGEMLKFTVPPGGDGKVWQITEGGIGVRFYFLNLPNILSLHPGRMLLPEELVERDQLPQPRL